ncbi:MAG TPA: hypothetical protein VFN19_04915 [Candidatus Nanopelagicales bacterium]|nr:hypothetical protein [Candidatus Nanopelagicales bacterium]
MGQDDLQGPSSEMIAGGVPLLLVIGLVLFAVLFVAVLVMIVVSASKRFRAAKRAGLDPFAADVQVMGALANSAALAPERPVADRLAEIDVLHRAGTISGPEREAARARILGTL